MEAELPMYKSLQYILTFQKADVGAGATEIRNNYLCLYLTGKKVPPLAQSFILTCTLFVSILFTGSFLMGSSSQRHDSVNLNLLKHAVVSELNIKKPLVTQVYANDIQIVKTTAQ